MATKNAQTARDRTRWLTPDELETWHAINGLISRLPAALGAQLQCDSDLSFLEYYVLASLSDQPDQTIRISRLAGLAHSELSRLSHLITRLERRGFVRREPDPSDGRFTHAILTQTGDDYLAAAAPGHVARVRELIFDVLDTDSQHAIRDAANAVLAQLDDGAC